MIISTMAHNQEANEALTEEVKDLVKDLQERNHRLFDKIEELEDLVLELRRELDDSHNKFYDV